MSYVNNKCFKQGMLMTVFSQLWKKRRDHLFCTSVCLAIHK